MTKANLLHEFKSPINRIRGLAQVLCSDESLNEMDRKAILRLIEANADRLTRSTESLLLHTSWDGKNIKLEHISADDLTFRMKTLILESQTFTTNAISLTHQLSESNQFQMDVPLVMQALDYLVNNANKFVSDGAVEVSAVIANGTLVISVSDDGPGMRKPHDATRPFWQESAGLSRMKSGLGLGLTVSEKIAQAHGGSLELISRHGSGLTAKLHLPVTIN